jgi:phage gp29-like protein
MAHYIDEQITELILGQNLTTEVKQGSLAAATVHDHVRKDIAHADTTHLIRTLERDIIRPLIDLNFGPQTFYPKLSLEPDHSLSRREKIDMALKFIPLGLSVSHEQIRELIGINPPLESDTLLKKS